MTGIERIQVEVCPPKIKTADRVVNSGSLSNPYYHSRTWARTRAYIRAHNPFCAICARNGTVSIDHMSGDIADNIVYNLLPLCNQCHGWKTSQFERKEGGSLKDYPFADCKESRTVRVETHSYIRNRVMPIVSQPLIELMESTCSWLDNRDGKIVPYNLQYGTIMIQWLHKR